MKKRLCIISVSFLFVVATLAGVLTACTQEQGEQGKTLYYAVGDTYQIENDQIVLTFDYAKGKKTISIPSYTYYDETNKQSLYYGALGVDQNFQGAMLIQYEISVLWHNLHYRLSEFVDENIFEIWYYEPQFDRVFAVFMIADEQLHNYVIGKVNDAVSEEVKAKTEYKRTITGMFSGEDTRMYYHDGRIMQEGTEE